MGISHLIHRSERSRARVLGALLLALFVFGQAYSVAHHALVSHTVCEDDGRLVHGEHIHGHGERASGSCGASAAEHDAGGSPEVALSDDSDEHGGECSVPTPREEGVGPQALPFLAYSLAGPMQSVDALRTQVFECRIARFRLAPKQSPPHVIA